MATPHEAFLAMSMCPKFDGCDAPLCVLDPDVGIKEWWIEEDICTQYPHRITPIVKAQRRMQKRQAKGTADFTTVEKGFTGAELAERYAPISLTDEQRSAARERMKSLHAQRATGE